MIPSDTIGYLASALVLATFCMRRMAPLRIAAICSNLAFIAYALQRDLAPVLVLHLVLLPLNLRRLLELRHPLVADGPAPAGSSRPNRAAEGIPPGPAVAAAIPMPFPARRIAALPMPFPTRRIAPLPMPFPARRIAVRAALGLALAAAPAARLAASSAPDLADPWLQAVWLAPAPTRHGEAGAPGTLAVLHIPAGWSLGDAAVVVLWDGGGARPGSRDRVSQAFVAAGAAVLELDHPPPSPAPDGSAADPSLLPRALQALRRDLGAGLLVAIGKGEGGRAALSGTSAVRGASAGAPAGGPALAAAVAIAGGHLRAAPGETPGASEAWPVRGRLLCEVLAAAVATEAEGEQADPAMRLVRRDDCLAGLRLR